MNEPMSGPSGTQDGGEMGEAASAALISDVLGGDLVYQHTPGEGPQGLVGEAELYAPLAPVLWAMAMRGARDTLLPAPVTAGHRAYTYWMHFAEGSLMPPFVMKLVFDKVRSAPVPFFLKPVTKGIADKVMNSFVGPNIKNNMDFIESTLAGRDWFAGSQLTGADFQMSFPLEAAVAGRATGNFPHITAWVKKVQARPAYQRALKAGGPYDYA